MSFYGPVRVFREFKLGGFWRTKSCQRDMELELKLLELELNEGARVWGEDASLKLCLPVSSRANINNSNSLSIQFSLIRPSVLQFHHPPNNRWGSADQCPHNAGNKPKLRPPLLLVPNWGLLYSSGFRGETAGLSRVLGLFSSHKWFHFTFLKSENDCSN